MGKSIERNYEISWPVKGFKDFDNLHLKIDADLVDDIAKGANSNPVEIMMHNKTIEYNWEGTNIKFGSRYHHTKAKSLVIKEIEIVIETTERIIFESGSITKEWSV